MVLYLSSDDTRLTSEHSHCTGQQQPQLRVLGKGARILAEPEPNATWSITCSLLFVVGFQGQVPEKFMRANATSRRFSKPLVILACATVAMTAHGASMGFLKQSPLLYFKQDDIDRMIQNARTVLDSPQPSAKEEWSNPKSGASGFAQVRSQFTTTDGTPCKRLLVGTAIHGLENETTYLLCKSPSRGWVMSPNAKPAS
jgi:hypothetical protein